ncbi:hypothetical protein Tco_0549202 [Tanacetum coccineum]
MNLPRIVPRKLKEGGEVRLSRSDEVLKLKNFKKDATLKLFKSTNQVRGFWWVSAQAKEIKALKAQDDSLKEKKGYKRSMYPNEGRMENLSNLPWVNHLVHNRCSLLMILDDDCNGLYGDRG